MLERIFSNLGTYAERMVGRLDDGDLMVSTARVYDSDFPYETAVAHPNYNGGKWVIVENYLTRNEAECGHERWVAEMTGEVLPAVLTDVSQALVAQFLDAFDEDWRDRPAKGVN